MTLSRRGRRRSGVISLVVIGLLISDVATYALLQSSLISRIDSQLTSGHNEAVGALGGSGRGPAPSQFPTGTGVELLGLDGSVVEAKITTTLGATPSSARPILPKTLANAGMDRASAPITVDGTNGVTKFRMTDWPENSFGGQFVILAIPLTDVKSTLSQLLQLDGLIAIGVAAATSLLALVLIPHTAAAVHRRGIA